MSRRVHNHGPEDGPGVGCRERLIGDCLLLAEANRAVVLRDALEAMAYQFGYWSDRVGGIGTGGLSALEEAFVALGWRDPRPVPEMRCDEPGCLRESSIGWPTRPGGNGLNGGYRSTCHTHWCALHPGECGSHPILISEEEQQ